MSLSLSHKLDDIFGGEIEALNGHHIITAAKFAVLGKLPTPEELVKMEERRAKRRSGAEVEKGGPRTPKTYAVITWKADGSEATYENRYAVGFWDKFTPGADTENYAKGKGNEGPEGPFILKGEQYQDKNIHLSESRYDTYPTLIRMLYQAGVPAELLESIYTDGIDVLAGVGVDLFPKVEEYTDEATGEKKQSQPVNLPLKNSYKDHRSAAAGKPKPAAAQAPAPAAAAAAAAAAPADAGDDEAIASVFDAVLDDVVAKMAEGEAVNRADVARGFPAFHKDMGSPVTNGAKVVGMKAAIEGKLKKGDLLELFNARLTEKGLEIDDKGVFSIG